MKKFQVECKVANAEQIDGTKPRDNARIDFIGDYIEAETEIEAIELAYSWIFENVRNARNGIDGAILLKNEDGEVVQELYHFKATEIKII